MEGMEIEWGKYNDTIIQSRKEVVLKKSSGRGFVELMIHEQKF